MIIKRPSFRSIFRLLKFKHRKINTRKFINRILTNRHPVSSYVELERATDISTTRHHQTDISMQYLDAKSLLLLARSEPERQMQYREFGTGTANSSQCGSSLDLEWENDYETGPSSSAAPHHLMWINIPKPLQLPEKSPLSHSSSDSSSGAEKKDNSIECSAKVHERKATSWSHISTPDSMEWDVVTEDNRLKSEDCDSVDQDTRDLLFEIEQLKNRALQETGQFDYDLNRYEDEAC